MKYELSKQTVNVMTIKIIIANFKILKLIMKFLKIKRSNLHDKTEIY